MTTVRRIDEIVSRRPRRPLSAEARAVLHPHEMHPDDRAAVLAVTVGVEPVTRVLMVLTVHGPLTAAEIAEQSELPKQTVERIVRRLRRSKAIARVAVVDNTSVWGVAS